MSTNLYVQVTTNIINLTAHYLQAHQKAVFLIWWLGLLGQIQMYVTTDNRDEPLELS